MDAVILTISDLRIIDQALGEYEESEYAGEVDIARARVARGRVSEQIRRLEREGLGVTELECDGRN